MLLSFIVLHGRRMVSERSVNGNQIRWPFTGLAPLGKIQNICERFKNYIKYIQALF